MSDETVVIEMEAGDIHIKMDGDTGEIFVNSKLIEHDKELIDGMRKWLERAQRPIICPHCEKEF